MFRLSFTRRLQTPCDFEYLHSGSLQSWIFNWMQFWRPAAPASSGVVSMGELRQKELQQWVNSDRIKK